MDHLPHHLHLRQHSSYTCTCTLLNIPVNLFPLHTHTRSQHSNKARLRLSQSVNYFSVHKSYLLSNLHVLHKWDKGQAGDIILTCANSEIWNLLKCVKIRCLLIGNSFYPWVLRMFKVFLVFLSDFKHATSAAPFIGKTVLHEIPWIPNLISR